jgi:hypothetical protein
MYTSADSQLQVGLNNATKRSSLLCPFFGVTTSSIRQSPGDSDIEKVLAETPTDRIFIAASEIDIIHMKCADHECTG